MEELDLEKIATFSAREGSLRNDQRKGKMVGSQINAKTCG